MISSLAKTFCLSDPALDNQRKAKAAGGLRELTDKAAGAEQMEIARLKAEPAKPRMARDILKKSGGVFRESAAAVT
jgi:transposase-like protein